MNSRILYVDDEPKILDAFKRVIRNEPFTCITFESAQKALDKIDEIKPAVVISDQRMPEMQGTDFLEKVKKIRPDTVRMVMTGYPDAQVAISAINKGNVYRFLQKPWDEDALKKEIKEAVSYYEMMESFYHFSGKLANQNELEKERMKGVMELAGSVSHALCQPLQVIQGYADIMLMGIDKEHNNYIYLSNLQKQIAKMKYILISIQSIKKYSICKHAGDLRMIDLEKSSSKD